MAWAEGWQYPVYKEDGTIEKAETVKNGGTSYEDQFQTRLNLLLDFVLNYNKYFDAIKTSVDVTGGYSWQKFKNKGRSYSYVNNYGYLPGTFEHDPAYEQYLGVQANPTNYFRSPHQLVSFFGRANFVFLCSLLRYVATVHRVSPKTTAGVHSPHSPSAGRFLRKISWKAHAAG